MTLKINVHADIKQVLHKLGRLQQGKINAAASRALNKTVTNVRTQAVRAISKDIGIQQKKVRDNIIVRRAKRHYLQASLSATNKRFKLIDIDPRAKQTPQGVRLKQPGGRRVIPHAFIITPNQSRRPAIVKRKTLKRYPLIELRGASVARVFVTPMVMNMIQQTANQAWLKNFNHELNYELSKP